MTFNNLVFKVNEATEAAAIACVDWIGRGDNNAADQAAVNAMRNALGNLPIDGEVVIGEGERDKAPMLYIGEKINGGDLQIDIAVDPLEGTNLCANNKENAIAVVAIGPKNTLLKAPDTYMRKIAVGINSDKKIIDINVSTKENIQSLAGFKNCAQDELKAIVLKRERHADIIAELRELGVRVQLIDDGDILGVIATTTAAADLYIGTGGAPEGVIAASALKCLGGQMQCQLVFENDAQIQRAATMGIKDPDRVYNINDMVKDDVIFCATGVTDGVLLKGVKKSPEAIETHSFITSYPLRKTVQLITSHHCDRVSR
jgi:fructose-1,6-bisphosphatase II / sedoheptulose-1,7-bisphosphatase